MLCYNHYKYEISSKEVQYMRGFIGTSQSDNISEAVEQATKGLKKADLLILIAPFIKAEKSAEYLAEKYPGTPMIGTTSASYTTKGIDDSSIMVIAFAGVTVATGVITNTRKTPVTSILEFEETLNSIEPESENTICLEFNTGNEEKLLATINSVLKRYDISLAGSSAYGTPLGDKNQIIYNGKLMADTAVYAFVKNNAGRIIVGKENIYKRLSEKPHFATLVDRNTKTLFQLDDTPAHEIYTAETGVEKEGIVENMLVNPLGRAAGDDTFITATASLDMNGVMFNGKAVFENETIYIMEPDDIGEISMSTIEGIMDNLNSTSFTLCFDSVNRFRYIAGIGFLDQYLTNLSQLGTYAGIMGVGQQINNQHVNQTLVYVTFE